MNKRLFPTGISSSEWVQFRAEGFSEPVCGVIYRLAQPATNGMPLGGIDTGCIDLETSGLLGYCTIFNSHVPRRGPLNLPFLGISVKGHTWVLCDPTQPKAFKHLAEGKSHPVSRENCHDTCGGFPLELFESAHMHPSLPVHPLKLEGVSTVKDIHYWGHYPVADMEFETDAPVSVGLRAWAPFFPGDIVNSMLPGIVFEVHLRNPGNSEQKGSLVFSFPGPLEAEAGEDFRKDFILPASLEGKFWRPTVSGAFNGVTVSAQKTSYALGVIGEKQFRWGGELGTDGSAWAKVAEILPKVSASGLGTSVAVDFILPPKEKKVVRFILTWHSPQWNSRGYPSAPEGSAFTHMYAKYWPGESHSAYELALNHESLLRRILAWQEVIYTAQELPGWLKDVLINNFHLIPEVGMWAQAMPPIGDWCRSEDGIWGLNECPRGCPQIECGGNTYYGGMAVQYFFPQLTLSTLRAKKAYQFPDGCPTWVFGGVTAGTPPCDMARPAHGYQIGQNGSWYVGEVARYWMRTGDDNSLREFYPSLKKTTVFTFSLNPEQPYGLISLPEFDKQESYESTPFKGMSSHVASIRLYHLKMMEKIAEHVGDTKFALQCRKWLKQSVQLMEEHLWEGSYYLQHKDPVTGEVSKVVMGYQLDGEFMSCFDGIKKGVFPKERTKITLAKLRTGAMEEWGPRVWSNAEGGPVKPEEFNTGYWTPYGVHSPAALMLAMTYMYRGDREFGLELARRVMFNMVCRNRWTWDMPILYRGDTGEGIWGNDYAQMMMCWALPAAVVGKDLKAFSANGGLVDRIIQVCKKSLNRFQPQQ